jgi:hypothetical protein
MATELTRLTPHGSGRAPAPELIVVRAREGAR